MPTCGSAARRGQRPTPLRRRVAAGLLAALAPLALGCGERIRAPAAAPRLVLLYAPCTVSRTFLAPYDPGIHFTPGLARLAGEAVTFTAHRTEAGSSGIAYAALFSGTQADRHRVFQHPSAMREESYLLAEAFADNGFETYFWNAHGMASTALNYGQGVEPERAYDRELRADDEQFAALLDGLRADSSRRAFVMTNFTLTHGPYRAETVDDFLAAHPGERLDIDDGERQRLTRLYSENTLAFAYNFDATVRRLGLGPQDISSLAASVELAYKANVWLLDRAFARVVAALEARRLLADSVVVFTTDHGEVLYRDTELFKWTHSSLLAPEVLEIPLLIRAPGLAPGRYAAVTRSIDVLPTLLGLASLEVPADRPIDGRNLTAALLGLEPPPDLTAYSHTSVIPQRIFERMQRPGGEAIFGNRMRLYPRPDIRLAEVAMRREDLVFKLRSDGNRFSAEAFDRGSDPWESRNVLDPASALHRETVRDMRHYKSVLVAAAAEGPAPGGPSPEEAERQLRALGYLP